MLVVIDDQEVAGIPGYEKLAPFLIMGAGIWRRERLRFRARWMLDMILTAREPFERVELG